MTYYDTGELFTIVALFAFAAYLAGKQHSDAKHRRERERRAAIRRRHQWQNRDKQPQLFHNHNQERHNQ